METGSSEMNTDRVLKHKVNEINLGSMTGREIDGGNMSKVYLEKMGIKKVPKAYL